MAAQRGKAISVVAGPARSGKTARVEALFLDACRARESCLMLVPDEASARAFRRRILASLPCIETDAVTTLSALARRVLAASGVRAREASLHERELLLRSIVAGLDSAGRLEHFAPVTDFPGFFGRVEEFFRDIASSCAAPDSLKPAGAASPRDWELSTICSLYAAALEEARLCDAEGAFRLARESVESGLYKSAPRRLLVDGFAAFTPNELAFLCAFASRAGDVTITLPCEDGALGRSELFACSADTLARISERFRVDLTTLAVPQRPTACAAIALRFLAAPETARPVPCAGGVRVIATAGSRMEAEEIAREAKRLIRGGRRARDLAVVLRDRSFEPLLGESFARAGVPLDSRPLCAPESSPVFAVLRTALEVLDGDFPAPAVTRLLCSSYVDLARLAGGAVPRSDIPRIIREAAVVKGASQWNRRLKALARRLLAEAERRGGETTVDEDGVEIPLPPLDASIVELLLNAFERLEEVLRPLRRPAPAAELALAVRALAEALGMRAQVLEPGVPEEMLFRDLAAFGALRDALDYLASSDGEAAMGAAGFLELVSRTVRAARAPSGQALSGGVALLDAERCAGSSFPVVFLCGASSEAYPARAPVGPFHNRAEREALAAAGVYGVPEARRLASERLLFYLAATRAEETLYVTYPSADEGGKPKLASFYVGELESLFTFSDGDRVSHGPSRVAAPLEEAASPLEASVAAGACIAKAVSSDEVVVNAMLAAAVEASFPTALRAAAIETRREALRSYNSFDGVLSGAAAQTVAARFSPGRPWSGTQLSDYTACPMKFFLARVLGVDRPEDAQVVPTPLVRGGLAHEILAAVFREIRDGGERVQFDDPENAFDACSRLLDSVSAAIYRRHEARFGLGGDPFWAIEQRRNREMLRRFLQGEAGRMAKGLDRKTFAPAFFELAFGLRERDLGDEDADRSSTEATVEVSLDGRLERLRGKIDRIDYLGDGAPGGREAVVIDYKLSNSPSKKDIEEYVDMQMPFYVYAAPRVVAGEGIVPVAAFYRGVRDGKGKRACFACAGAAAYAGFCGSFAAALFKAVDALRSGAFQPSPARGCPSYCIGRGVCRHSASRDEYLEGDDE